MTFAPAKEGARCCRGRNHAPVMPAAVAGIHVLLSDDYQRREQPGQEGVCARLQRIRGAFTPVFNGLCPAMTSRRANLPLSARPLDRVGEISLLPGEATVLFRRAAEMAVRGGAAVNRAVKLQRAADVGRREPEQLR